MTIDRIDWHWDSITEDIPEDEHWERAGAHIGYYMEWAYKKGFAPTNPETNNLAEYNKVVNSEITGIQFLIENCDTKFWDVDLSEEGLKFTLFAYDNYLGDYEKVVGHKAFSERYNQEDYLKVAKYLDQIYEEFLKVE